MNACEQLTLDDIAEPWTEARTTLADVDLAERYRAAVCLARREEDPDQRWALLQAAVWPGVAA